jgi:hypothetical protein
MTRARETPETATVHVPFRLVKRGGRKEMVLPPGAADHRPRVDKTIIKALARAFRWKAMLESGQFATTAELAEHEGIAVTYMNRVLRLTLLSPRATDAIVNGHQPLDLKLADLLEPFPMEWVLQWWDRCDEM